MRYKNNNYMAQEEILELLEKKGEMTIRQISKEIGISIPAIWKNLTELYGAGEVERIEINYLEVEKYNLSKRGCKHFIWRFKNGKKQ